MYSSIVPTNKLKNILLPFNGLYHSYLDSQLDSDIEYLTDELNGDDKQKVNDLIYDNVDFKRFNQRLVSLYSETLEDTLNYEYNTSISFQSVNYIGLNGQNLGDKLECNVNVDCLPSIQDISELMSLSIAEVWTQLQILSDEQFSSKSGFTSFYDTDLKPLHDVSYANWNEGYIMLIIQLLLNYASNVDNVEQNTIEAISKNYCDSVDMAYSFISNDSVITELNKLLDY